jgi:CheY-like chemotaxis protein
VFANLLNNASKYTEPGGEVRVGATVSAGFTAVTVADTGLGMDPGMLTSIFDMFTQLQAHRDRTQGGLGIGLTLARRLVVLHGGSIEAQSEGLGRGSRFVVRLPLAQPVEERASSGAGDRAPSCPCRVLVAEDNPDAAEMMRVMLNLKGHEVRVASDGVAAVEIARAFRPHIAFLDIGMPRMDGYEAAQHVRRLFGNRITLVALTGWGQDEDKRRSREAGFDHHLTKPPEPEVLDALIARCAAAE